MTTTAPATTPPDDVRNTRLVELLRVIGAGDVAGGPLDSASLRRRLGWPATEVAASLDDARRRLLVWGIRVGGSPAPCFEDIELTVQGRRLLRTSTPLLP